MNGYRVVYGWSAYDDFDTLEWAESRMAELAREPTSDDLCRRVTILDRSVTPHPTIATVQRPAA